MLFKIKADNSLSFYEPVNLDAEKVIQHLIENHLKPLFGYQFLATEFAVDTFGNGVHKNYRFDSVAFDPENKAFIIIEYKNVKNSSLMDQGFAYLAALKQRKESFVLLYNQKNNVNLGLDDFDWTQSRILFIAPSFTDFQLDSTSYKGLPFFLYKFQAYKDGTIEMDQVLNQITEPLDLPDESSEIAEVKKEVVVYTEDDQIKKLPENLQDLYGEFKEALAALGDFQVVANKFYIAFKRNGSNFCDVELYKSKLCIYINLSQGELKDEYHLAEDCSGFGHHANGDYRVAVTDNSMIKYIANVLVKQAYLKIK